MEKIAIFGVGLTFNDYYDMLRCAYDVCILVDNDMSKWGKAYGGMICQSPDALIDAEVDKIVILTMWNKYIEEIRHQLSDMGLIDKVCLMNELQGVAQYNKLYNAVQYTDDFHNTIIVEEDCSIDSLSVVFAGSYNNLVIHKKVRVVGSIYCNFRGEGCSIEIGDNTSIISASMYASEGGKIIIGDDCMIAHSVNVMQTACHPFYDISTGLRINTPRNIEIDRHVWIGQNVALMPGFSIGEGSIIGYGAISSSKFPSNCTIAGNPAKIVRENVIWKRNAVGYGDFNTYDEE